MSGYFTIGFQPDAGEVAEEFVEKLHTYFVSITTADGKTANYILHGTDEWDGHEGQPLQVQLTDDQNDGIGPVFTVDAKHVLVY